MENISISESELLQFAIQNGMIDTALVQEKIEMQKREKILEKHPYTIWEGKNGKWYTYLPDDGKSDGRRLIKRNTEDALKKVIFEFYRQAIEEPHFDTVFYEWINKKLEYKEISTQTYNRYETDFKYLLKETDLCKKKIKDIDEFFLEDYIKTIIAQKELTAKKWSNLRVVIKGTFRYAKSKGYTNLHITEFLNEIELSPRAFKKKYRSADELVFNHDEITKVRQYINNAKPSIINLGILLDFLTGLRPGELAALKWEDIRNNRIIVKSTEIHYKKEDERICEVRPFPKTEAGFREVILNPEANEILRQIKLLNPFGIYVFMKDDERVKGKAFTQKLTRICRYTGIAEKSLNKARKTYATTLINGNVDEALIISMMGHTDLRTTKGYYYVNNATKEQEEKQIFNALSKNA